MLKVAILTFHGVDNYGAVLQAYALKQVLKAPGRQVSFIDYRPATVESPFRWSWKRGGLLGRNVINLRLNPLFAKFRAKHLPANAERYQTLNEMEQNPPDVDVAFFGSDQIWNPGMFGGRFDPAYFGSFLRKETHRVSYAASFGGGSRFNEEQRDELRTLLSPFKAISVREELGAELVGAVCGIRPMVTLDPTLMLTDYDPLLEPVEGTPRDFIFLFAMQYSAELKSAAVTLSRELGRPVLMALSSTTGLKIFDRTGKGVMVSPGQWLWLIKHASLVLTNSFHAAVFSIVFQRPFLTIPLIGHMAARNDRISNLLRMAKIPARMVTSATTGDLCAQAKAEIDWSEVSDALKTQRQASLGFIERSFQDVPPSRLASG